MFRVLGIYNFGFDLNHNVAVACVDEISIAAEFDTYHFGRV